jgi:multidrug resistance protein
VALGLVFLTVLLDLVGFGIIIPLLPYFATELGATALQIGLIGASYSLMQFVFAPVWGGLSDRFGRRPLLLVGLFGSALSYLMFGLAGSLQVLLLSRIIGGIMGATVPVAQAIVADSTTPDRRARGMGMIGAAFGLGFIFGPWIGGELSHFGYGVPGLVAAAVTGLNAVAAVFFLPESLPPERRVRGPGGWATLVERAKSARRALGRPTIRGPIFVFFLMTLGFAGFTLTLPLFLADPLGLSAKITGRLFAYVGLISAAIQGRLIGPLVERYGERHVAVAGGLLLAAGIAGIALFPTLPPLFATLALVGVGWGCVVPSLQSLISRRALPREQGEILGVNQSAASAARVIGPVAAGWGFGVLGWRLGFLGGAGLILLGAIFAWTMRDDPDAFFG